VTGETVLNRPKNSVRIQGREAIGPGERDSKFRELPAGNNHPNGMGRRSEKSRGKGDKGSKKTGKGSATIVKWAMHRLQSTADEEGNHHKEGIGAGDETRKKGGHMK